MKVIFFIRVLFHRHRSVITETIYRQVTVKSINDIFILVGV